MAFNCSSEIYCGNEKKNLGTRSFLEIFISVHYLNCQQGTLNETSDIDQRSCSVIYVFLIFLLCFNLIQRPEILVGTHFGNENLPIKCIKSGK